jgi:hypothetical protein
VLDHVFQSGKSAIVVEPALVDLLGIPERPQRGRIIRSIRRSLGLEVVKYGPKRKRPLPGGLRERLQSDLGQTPELSIRVFFEVGFKHCPEFSVLDGIPELEFNGASSQ